MPPLNANDSRWQYTGMGWKKVKPVEEEEMILIGMQNYYAQRRLEIINKDE